MSTPTLNCAAFSKAALKDMRTQEALKHFWPAIDAYLAPKPQQVAEAAPKPMRPTDTSKTYHKISRNITGVVYSKGYIKLEGTGRDNLVMLYKDAAQELISTLQALIASGQIKSKED